jgi:membrane associated rhomboid family serine protease
MRDRRVLTFLGVWFGLNLLFGLTSGQTGLASGTIAWEAHIGGFVAGLLLFPLFDPVKPLRR